MTFYFSLFERNFVLILCLGSLASASNVRPLTAKEGAKMLTHLTAIRKSRHAGNMACLVSDIPTNTTIRIRLLP